MRRILVDLRVFLATVAVLGVALAFVSLGFLGIYGAPIEHIVRFQGGTSAKVENYSTIVRVYNFTESGVPQGALLGFSWTTGFGGDATILAYSGTNLSARNITWGPGDGCAEGPAFGGSCSWTAQGPSFTVSITDVNCPPEITFCHANYTATAGIQGWYSYSTPAR